MTHLAMSKKVAWPTLIFAILLVGVCVIAHYHPWLKPVCHALEAITGLGLFATSGYFLLKGTTGGAP